jgi:diphthamide synthase (EF-2-diphthine--ammonia ligase)
MNFFPLNTVFTCEKHHDGERAHKKKWVENLCQYATFVPEHPIIGLDKRSSVVKNALNSITAFCVSISKGIFLETKVKRKTFSTSRVTL